MTTTIDWDTALARLAQAEAADWMRALRKTILRREAELAAIRSLMQPGWR